MKLKKVKRDSYGYISVDYNYDDYLNVTIKCKKNSYIHKECKYLGLKYSLV